jgi:large subunit ribosomal protein L29
MKAAKWRDLSDDEIRQRARELAEELFNVRFQISMGMAKNPSRLGQARRDLARAKTILRERGATPVMVAAAPEAAPVAAAAPPARRRRTPKAKAGTTTRRRSRAGTAKKGAKR